jgi:hypothetical protein
MRVSVSYIADKGVAFPKHEELQERNAALEASLANHACETTDEIRLILAIFGAAPEDLKISRRKRVCYARYVLPVRTLQVSGRDARARLVLLKTAEALERLLQHCGCPLGGLSEIVLSPKVGDEGSGD